MNKKDVCKLKAGTWIEVLWEDAPPEVALLLQKPETCNGDVSIKCLYPKRGDINSHAVHTQVACVLGTLQLPEGRLSPTLRYGDKIPTCFPTKL